MGMTLLKSFWDGAGDFLSSVVGTILWGLCDIFFLLIDLCQILFRKFAGLDTINVDGVKVEGDVIIYLLESNVVQDVFFSLLILSLFLLVIFTLFAVVKNMYSDKPKAPMSIIANSMKGMLNYLMVPVCVVVGLAVGNVILQAVDGATKTHAGDVSASSMLFEAATYNANKLRSGSLDNRREDFAYMLDEGYLDNMLNDLEPIFGTSNKDALIKKAPFAQESDLNLAAGVLDSAFTRGVLCSNQESNLEKYNPVVIFRYYNALRVSYITIWAGGGFLLYCLFNITWGLLNRIFKMVLGYCMTPVFISLYPMDEGKALKSWIGDFSKQATSAYAAVGVMNVFYSVLPFIRDINFMGGSGTGLFDLCVQLLVMISGYLLAKDMIGTVSGWVGTGNALADGKAASGALMKPIKSTVSGAYSGLVGSISGYKAAKDKGQNKFFGTLMGAYQGTGLSQKFDITSMADATSKAKKGAEEYYKKVKTTNLFTGTTNKDKDAEFKGREIIDKENKKLDKLFNDLAAATDDTAKEVIIKKMESTSSYVREQIEDIKQKLSVREEKATKKEGRVSKLEQFAELGKNIQDMAREVYGFDATSAQINDLLAGRISSLSTDQKRRWALYKDSLIATKQGFENARISLSKLKGSDNGFKDMVAGTDMDKFSTVVLGTDGDFSVYEDAVKTERGNVNDLLKDISDERKNLYKEGGEIQTKANIQKSGGMTAAEYRDVGKSSDK